MTRTNRNSNRPKKQFMFLGYGNYNSRGGASLFDVGGLVTLPTLF